MRDDPLMEPPDYDGSGLLSDVIPAAAIALDAGHILDATQQERATRVGLDAQTRVVVVALIDGLGLELLRGAWAYAPFLRSLKGSVTEFSAGFPSTTANSLSSLGTGLLPGAHGVVGYRVRDPETGDIINQLTWDSHREASTWVPDDSLFERLVGAGVDMVSLGEPKFVGRGLNAASLRGGRFRGSTTLAARIDDAIDEATHPGSRLVYVYWGALDKTGHGRGTDSAAWTTELEAVDAELARLATSLPKDALLIITADHGMVNVEPEDRIDVRAYPQLCELLTGIGGEPRATHFYTRHRAEVAHMLRDICGTRVEVMDRYDAIDAGWFGPVRVENFDRIGDVIAVSGPNAAIVDSLKDSKAALKLRGHHGGVTREELAIPVIAVQP